MNKTHAGIPGQFPLQLDKQSGGGCLSKYVSWVARFSTRHYHPFKASLWFSGWYRSASPKSWGVYIFWAILTNSYLRHSPQPILLIHPASKLSPYHSKSPSLASATQSLVGERVTLCDHQLTRSQLLALAFKLSLKLSSGSQLHFPKTVPTFYAFSFAIRRMCRVVLIRYTSNSIYQFKDQTIPEYYHGAINGNMNDKYFGICSIFILPYLDGLQISFDYP